MDMEFARLIVSALPGIVAIITLIYELVKYVRKSIKEKNWGDVMDMVIRLMKTAEAKFEDGAERKEWVLSMLKASADKINYDIDYDAISKMIDNLCDMSKVVNSPAEKAGE